MQVVWDIHSHLLQANGIAAPEDLHDPDRGVAAGCLLLSRYMRVSDNTRKALLRYSGGSIDTYWNKITRILSKIREHAVAWGSSPEARVRGGGSAGNLERRDTWQQKNERCGRPFQGDFCAAFSCLAIGSRGGSGVGFGKTSEPGLA
jgi:hypothetical protein